MSPLVVAGLVAALVAGFALGVIAVIVASSGAIRERCAKGMIVRTGLLMREGMGSTAAVGVAATELAAGKLKGYAEQMVGPVTEDTVARRLRENRKERT